MPSAPGISLKAEQVPASTTAPQTQAEATPSALRRCWMPEGPHPRLSQERQPEREGEGVLQGPRESARRAAGSSSGWRRGHALTLPVHCQEPLPGNLDSMAKGRKPSPLFPHQTEYRTGCSLPFTGRGLCAQGRGRACKEQGGLSTQQIA